MILNRNDLVAAIIYWGEHGSPVEVGSQLTVEAGKLVDVLGRMDYERQATVDLSGDTERLKLINAVLAAR